MIKKPVLFGVLSILVFVFSVWQILTAETISHAIGAILVILLVVGIIYSRMKESDPEVK